MVEDILVMVVLMLHGVAKVAEEEAMKEKEWTLMIVW